MPETAAEAFPLTTDCFLGERISLRQPRRGHRAGTDAVLLAAGVPAAASGLVLDIGSGVGAAGLAVAALRPGAVLGLVENDAALAPLAAENLSLNGLDGRGRVHLCDVLDPASRRNADLVAGGADVVVTNPPFFDPARGRASPQAAKRSAHVMPISGPAALEAWVGACLALLADGGLFVMIHRPDVLPVLLRVTQNLGGLTLLAVHPHGDKPASRILLRGRKGSRAPFSIAPPLVLHAGEGFTTEAQAIHRGEALLNW
jgi:tRNA1(Val) A37 N6-methylase TrmN6